MTKGVFAPLRVYIYWIRHRKKATALKVLNDLSFEQKHAIVIRWL